MSNKNLNISELDPSAVISNDLTGWRCPFWIFFGMRPYPRNCISHAFHAEMLFYYFSVALTIIVFNFFPWKYYGAIFLLGVNGITMISPVSQASESPFIPWLHVMLSLLGLYTDQHFGIALFGYHFEKYFYWGYLFGGVLGVYRRTWNALVWRILDRIVLKYYRDHDLDLKNAQVRILSYQEAYDKMCNKFCDFLAQCYRNELISDGSPSVQQVSQWLKSRTQQGLQKATECFYKEIQNEHSN